MMATTTATKYGALEINSAVRAGDVRDNDSDRAYRLGMLRGLDTSALVTRIDAYHAFLTTKQYRKDYPIGSARRSICAQYLIEACAHYLNERGGQGADVQDWYMEIWAVAHAAAAQNLRAQIKRNKVGQ